MPMLADDDDNNSNDDDNNSNDDAVPTVAATESNDTAADVMIVVDVPVVAPVDVAAPITIIDAANHAAGPLEDGAATATAPMLDTTTTTTPTLLPNSRVLQRKSSRPNLVYLLTSLTVTSTRREQTLHLPTVIHSKIRKCVEMWRSKLLQVDETTNPSLSFQHCGLHSPVSIWLRLRSPKKACVDCIRGAVFHQQNTIGSLQQQHQHELLLLHRI